MSFVWDRFDGEDHLLLPALAMSDYANDDGAGIYASMTTIAQKIRRDERTARRQVRALEQLGFLEVTGIAPPPYLGTAYRISPRWLSEHGYEAPHKGRRGGRGGGGMVSPGGGTVPPAQAVDNLVRESSTPGASCPHPGGTESSSPGASCPETRGHGAPQSFLRNPEEIRESARESAWKRPDDPEAKAKLREQRRAELADLEAEYVAAGFRAPNRIETPTSYRTAYRLWREEQRVKGAASTVAAKEAS